LIFCQDSRQSLIIVLPEKASPLEKLAAKEIRRYLYLRTGKLVSIEPRENLADLGRPAILVCQKERFLEADFADEELKQKVAGLGEQEYLLKTFPQTGRQILLVAGGDETGTLCGSYRLAEKMGVRFYLHGDAVPDRQVSLELPVIEERGFPGLGPSLQESRREKRPAGDRFC
jgi:alpha-glucuronidase